MAAVRAWPAADEQPTIVIGHSHGGVVTGAAAAGLAQVRRLVYIASFLPQVGESHAVEVATGHRPFLSQPSVVARLLLDLA